MTGLPRAAVLRHLTGALAVVGILVVGALAFRPDAGPPGRAARDTVPFALAGSPAPALAGPTVQGDRADLADLRGSVVLVNVWASWCSPCRQELPLLAGTQQRLGPRGLRVLGLLMKDRAGPARDLLARTGAQEIPSVEDPDGATAIAWGVRGVPETFVVDRQGRLQARWIGPLTPEWIRSTVEPLLAAP